MISVSAAVVREPGGPWSIEWLSLDEPREEEVLVRIAGVGICHTDISVRNQYVPVPLPAVLGHEGAGVVERVGERVSGVAPGDHVVLAPMSCGGCRNCISASPMYCEQFLALNLGMRRPDGSPTVFDGQIPVSAAFFGQSSFATRALAHQRSVVKVPSDLPIEILGPLGCGVMTGAGAVVHALAPRCGASIAVFGTGPVGMAAILAARVLGCATIVAVDLKQNRLDLAAELGATHTVLASQADPVKAVRKIARGGVDYALDSTANPAVARQAVDCLASPGQCVLVGLPPVGTEASFDLNKVLLGRSVRGVIEGDCVPQVFIPQLIELWRQGRFPFDRLIRTYEFSDVNRAVADALQGDVLKPVLRMS